MVCSIQKPIKKHDMDNEHRKFHDEFSEKINSNGCRWGNLQIQRLNDETKNIKEDYKSHYGSLEDGMNKFVEIILPNIQEKSRIASEKSEAALESLKRAEGMVLEMKKETNKWAWGLVVAIFLFIVTTAWSNISKINQDINNQERLEKILYVMLTHLEDKPK